MRPEKEKILRSHQIVQGQDIGDLEINITEALDDGWKLYGPMQAVNYQSYNAVQGNQEHYYQYYQQMVKKEYV